MAEQRSEKERQREEDLRSQYEKEQDLFNNRLLVSTESKDKLSLNFMYEAPAGASKGASKDNREDGDFKFEWQRNAPRESFAKGDLDVRDQPFGIQVKNVRCLKCHKWGHLNTDVECELNKSGSTTDLIQGRLNLTSSTSTTIESTTQELIERMKSEGGLTLKRSLIGQTFDNEKLDQQLLSAAQACSVDPEIAYLNSLSKKDKKKILKRLNAITGSTSSKTKKTKDRREHKSRKDKHLKSEERRREAKKLRSDSEDKHHRSNTSKTKKTQQTRHETDNRVKDRKSPEDRQRKRRSDEKSSSRHEGRHDRSQDRHQENRLSKNVKKEYSRSGDDSRDSKRRVRRRDD